MKYYCNQEEIDLNEKDIRNINEDKTAEGICYEKNGFVYKIHYKDDSDYIDEDSCKYLIDINTKRIFLPVDIIYDENKLYSGYKTVYIKTLKELQKRNKSLKRILEKSVLDFFTDIEEIENDIFTLSKKKVIVGDFGVHNMIDNGHLNIFDVSCFSVDFSNCLTKRKIEKNNFDELEILIGEIISDEIANVCESESLTRKVYSDFQKMAKVLGCVKMLEKETVGYDSVSEYVKDLCKTKRGR